MAEKPVYSDDEVEEILRRAIERQQQSSAGLRREELVEAAAEIGIDASYVDHAIEEIEAQRRAKAAARDDDDRVPPADERAIRRRLRNQFVRHMGTWLVVSTALFLMNALSSPGVWWFYWPMIGWGIGVGTHGINALFPSEATIEKLQSRQRRRDRKRRRRDREFELAVERGVERMLKNAPPVRVELPAAPKRVRAEESGPELDDDESTPARRAARR